VPGLAASVKSSGEAARRESDFLGASSPLCSWPLARVPLKDEPARRLDVLSARNAIFPKELKDRDFFPLGLRLILLESAIKRLWLKRKLQMTPGHFRVTFCLFFIAISRTKLFIQKMSVIESERACVIKTNLSCEKFCPSTCFDVKRKSETAC